ncbi:hypothetical protein ALC57_03594, partial [Trachymyrmex cornetzi]
KRSLGVLGRKGYSAKNIDDSSSAVMRGQRSLQKRCNAVTYHRGCCPIVDGLVQIIRAPTMADSLGKNKLSAACPNVASCVKGAPRCGGARFCAPAVTRVQYASSCARTSLQILAGIHRPIFIRSVCIA